MRRVFIVFTVLSRRVTRKFFHIRRHITQVNVALCSEADHGGRGGLGGEDLVCVSDTVALACEPRCLVGGLGVVQVLRLQADRVVLRSNHQFCRGDFLRDGRFNLQGECVLQGEMRQACAVWGLWLQGKVNPSGRNSQSKLIGFISLFHLNHFSGFHNFNFPGCLCRGGDSGTIRSFTLLTFGACSREERRLPCQLQLFAKQFLRSFFQRAFLFFCFAQCLQCSRFGRFTLGDTPFCAFSCFPFLRLSCLDNGSFSVDDLLAHSFDGVQCELGHQRRDSFINDATHFRFDGR
mmetsp:Transcript_39041/g.67590  ORF Transcript_39041/g.67590 Transcript_39041/m.67590 type:complete len:292 (+) Transcript_39041:1223-2098(+)